MLQLKNNTPFSAAITLLTNAQGSDTLFTIVKASFKIGSQWTLVEEQTSPQQEDVYWGEPLDSSLRFPSDYHPGKAATDIVMAGVACAPEQRPIRCQDVHLRVGNLSKTVRVFGNRHWDKGQISSPEVFTTMPLIYERAFGGKDVAEGQLRSAELRNPVGVGYSGKKDGAEMDGTQLPNLECPRQLIQTIRDRPMPACFAPVAASWQPRLAYAGTYDEAWQKNRAPFLPLDYSSRFMNCAHPELIYPEFMQGGEPVTISGMHPSGELHFTLPRVILSNKIEINGESISEGFQMESVVLDPNQLQLSIVWKSAFLCDKNSRKAGQVSVSLQR